MARRVVTRRSFLRHSVAATATGVVGALLAACAGSAAPTSAPAAASTSAPAAGSTSAPAAASTAAPAAAGAGPASASAPVAAGERRVEMWGLPATPTTQAVWDKVTPKIRSDKKLVLDWVGIPGGWDTVNQKINVAVAAKTVPDVIADKDFNVKQLAAKGAMQSLDDYFQKGTIDVKGIRKSVFDAMKYKGNTWAAPWPGSFIHGLYINKDMFEKAGLDPNKAPATWQELVDDAKKLTNDQAGEWGHCFYDLSVREYQLMMFSIYVGQCGGKIFNTDTSQLTLDTPEANEAMQWMYDMIWTWKIHVPLDQFDSRQTLIQAGKVGTWNNNGDGTGINELRANAPKLKFSFNQWPTYKTADNVDAPESLAILKDAKDRDSSWAAIEQLVQPDLDLQFASSRAAIPVFTENLSKGIYASDPDFAQCAKSAQNPQLRPRYWVDGYEAMSQPVVTELQAVWYNKKKVKEGLQAAEKAGNDFLQKYRQGS